MTAKLRATLALLALATPGWAAKEDVYALVGARVVTVSGSTLESATVVLRDGVIEAVGPSAAVPPDARVIDVKGLTLTPGLIDAFGGLGLPAAKPAGESGGRGAGAEAPPPLAPQLLALDKLKVQDALKGRDSGITTALVIGKDGVLPGRSALIDLVGDKADGMALKEPAALHLHMATLRRQYPSSIMGTVAYARQSLYDAIHYRDEWAAYERAPRGKKRPRYDAGLAAWQDVVAGRIPLVLTAYLENDVRRALGLADEFKIRVIVAGAPQAFRVAALLKAHKLPLIVGVNFDPPKAAAFFRGEDEEKEKREIEEAESNPAELAKAGVPFALGSGHAADYVAGIQKAIEKGLSRETALRAATLGAAEVLGVADRTGSLDAGKIANLVAWSGDPLTKDAKVKMVFVDGTLYQPDEKPDKDKKKDEEKPSVEEGR